MDVFLLGLCVMAGVAIGVSWWLGYRAAQNERDARAAWFERLTPEAQEAYLQLVAERARGDDA